MLRWVSRRHVSTALAQTTFEEPTVRCGALSLKNVGEKVVVCGWVTSARNHGRVLFAPLRDGTGVVQLVVTGSSSSPSSLVSSSSPPAFQESGSSPYELLSSLSAHSSVCVEGVVRARPPSQVNKEHSTGEVEVEVERVSLLNSAPSTMPFTLYGKDEEGTEANKLKYRYLDLRSPYLQNNIRLRSRLSMKAREYLHGLSFTEIETPTLFKSTPEGAREFLVPTRTPGKFYALPQSPQQYKQLLMAGGFERYFQFARCYRDEGQRADQQPEFTQIDMELTYVKKESVYEVIEGLISELWKEGLGMELPRPFPRLPFCEVMDRFGIDKPDLRFLLELLPARPLIDSLSLDFVPKTSHAVALVVPAMGEASRKDLEGLFPPHALAKAPAEAAAAAGSASVQPPPLLSHLMTLQWPTKAEEGWKGSLSKYVKSPGEQAKVAAALGPSFKPGSAALIGVGPNKMAVQKALGKARLEAAARLKRSGLFELIARPGAAPFEFLWVEDFPLFSVGDDGFTLESTHHPFTAPVSEDVGLLNSSPMSVRGQHYDVVVNGVELGGGSIRIHNANLQTEVFRKLGVSTEQGLAPFDHLITALRLGCPPHGGIALGFDRLVSIIAGAPSIRDVIAFPKSHAGTEPMTGSPSTPTSAQLAEYHVSLVSPSPLSGPSPTKSV